jgi:FkbM family methyltransferase
MIMFFDKIINAENRKLQSIQKMKSSSLPLLMYGAGSYAVDVSRLLSKQGIAVTAYCVDNEYYKENQYLNSIPVWPLQKSGETFQKYNLVIGFADYKQAMKKVEKVKNIENVFFIDAPHSLEFLDYQFVEKNKHQLQITYDMLEDQMSKEVFVAYLNSKIKGFPDELYDLADFNPYFTDIITLHNNEVFIDCGAYDGDTIVAFNKKVNGTFKKIVAFEPDNSNFMNLQKTITLHGLKGVVLIKKGCWNKATTLCFSSDGNMTSQVQDSGGIEIDVETIDTVIGNGDATLIKMDIEGSELQALQGASSVIQRCKPKLAICVYHKPEDLIDIPHYIKSLVPEYKLYLRHHQYISWETVLYAVV